MHPAAIVLPEHLLAPRDADMESFIDWVYEKKPQQPPDVSFDAIQFYAHRCIVTPTNETCLRMNNQILDSVPGKEYVSHSVDEKLDEAASNEHYPMEFLHTIESAGMPPHELKLKVGCVLMVLRNYAPHLGLCNGTRVMLVKVGKRILHVILVCIWDH